jgi:Protein of unknown function DUF262/Protein of unknown function (DUF1524)
VWHKTQQWEPLWEDIARKFQEYLSGRKDAPVHFLGAMVLDQKQTPTTHVEKRQIIDGQQRLTTLQIFLTAYRDFCAANECSELAKEADSFIQNKGMMADPEVDRFKVWPTQVDRDQFKGIVLAGSKKLVEQKFPLVRRKYARAPDPRPRMVEAYLFFYDQLAEFFIGTEAEPPLAADFPLPARLEECFQALRNSLLIVAIDLEQDDDAQVIFETLNARGEPLLPADLLRNYIFLRASRQDEVVEDLYQEHWGRFDEPFWRALTTQGRLSRPRSDLFMQHFLSSRLLVDIPVKHLFVEYKYWIERQKPFATVRDELATLARQGNQFRRLLEPKEDDPIFGLARFLQIFDIGTAYPFLLVALDGGLTNENLRAIAAVLESYLVRRAVCGLTNKNYNRVFTNLIKHVNKSGLQPDPVAGYLVELRGETVEWPTDEAFGNAFRTAHAYQTLNNARIVYILRRISEAYLTAKQERITVNSPLTVEHIMPQSWVRHWPLQDGSVGLDPTLLWNADTLDPKVQATRRRNSLVQTFGNLTICTQQLNSSASNSTWEAKKPELLAHSLLPINQQLHGVDNWDETAIERRAQALAGKALQIWPRIGGH